MTTLDGTIIASSSYQYDHNDNIVQATEKRQGKEDDVITYTYDGLNRLIGVNQPRLGQASYTYDLRGNRVTLNETRGMKENLNETSYSYNANDQLEQYTSDGKTTAKDSKGTVTKTIQKYISNVANKVLFEAKESEYNDYIRGDRVLLLKKLDSNTLCYYLYNRHADIILIHLFIHKHLKPQAITFACGFC